MWGFLSNLFSGGIVGSVERIASEAIQTDKETAEAKSLFIKTLDPNGMMRRELSRFTCKAYGFYLISTTALITAHAFGVGDRLASSEAMSAMTDLFVPITTAWGTIVSASFGVNFANVKAGK
jgi:hypothetical protein